MKKISEIIVEKEVSRIKFDENRNRYRENLVFNVRYNPTSKDVYDKRTVAKIIDVIFGIVLSLIFLSLIYKRKFDGLDILATTIIVVFILNSVLETIFGKSIGKFFKKISVINDYGNSPNLLTSVKRNFLSLVHVLSGFQFKPMWAIEPLPIGRNIHNEICKTYVVNDSDLTEIKTKLS